ncbi:MAG: exopolysaccharide biosynthesis polyprenyl glycosylphosphotransferase [Clostridia bacterium]|nr:exopolysaccharide biosynthesis polyprenyl glycosylphosphotransferase [Clostridia bacterium]MBQ9212271.1 exopolysaccharide biosynthesis polyprenyl glycosylphosphotransferase [Clostridia bacterium]
MNADERIAQSKKEYVIRVKLFIIKTLHFLITVGLFYWAFLFFRYREFPQIKDVAFRYNYFVTLGFAALILFFNRTYNSFLFGYTRISMLAFSQWLSQFFATVMIYVAVSLGWNHFRNPMLFLLLLVGYAVVDAVWSYVGNWYYYRIHPARKTLLIYRNMRDRRRFGYMTGKPTERLYRIEKELQFDGTFDEIRGELENYEAVFVAGVNSRCRNGILKYCEENGIRGFFLPHVGDVIMQGAEHIQAYDSPVLMARRKIIKPEYRLVKRIFDIVASAAGLILLSPLFLLTAAAIKLYDHGPVFYKQVRLTRDNRQFKIIKFRSMRVDAEKDGVARLSSGDNDDRITPIGRIVRKCRLDELPQLINILVGDMSIVGPRPERPEIAEQYYAQLPDFKLRLQVKAGLTGYAQVYGKYNTDPYEKLEFDLLYINNMSILTDLKLMFATAGVLFLPESTKGIEPGTITALDYEQEEQG